MTGKSLKNNVIGEYGKLSVFLSELADMSKDDPAYLKSRSFWNRKFDAEKISKRSIHDMENWPEFTDSGREVFIEKILRPAIQETTTIKNSKDFQINTSGDNHQTRTTRDGQIDNLIRLSQQLSDQNGQLLAQNTQLIELLKTFAQKGVPANTE